MNSIKIKKYTEALSNFNYVIFCQYISSIGGAQRYVLWKAKLLKQMGANVMIITTKLEPLILTEFLEYKVFLAPEISLPCYLFSRKIVRKAIERISTFIKRNMSLGRPILFESINIYLATWSEMIAKIFNSVSLIYEVSGSPIKNDIIAKFAATKLEQHELIGCSCFLLRSLFENFPYFLDSHPNEFINIAFDRNAIKDSIEDPLPSHLSGNSDALGILTVSRVAKPYLMGMIREVINVAKLMKDRKFFLTLVLNKKSGIEVKKLQKLAINAPDNLEIVFIGPLVPLPLSLFKKHQIFIGQGTSALHAIYCGLPTIIASSNSGMSSGIFGIDVFEFGYSKQYNFKISDLLIKLIDTPELVHKAKIKGLEVFKDNFSEDVISNKFKDWIMANLGKSQETYFSFENVSLNKKEKVKKMLLKLFRIRAYRLFWRMYRACFPT